MNAAELRAQTWRCPLLEVLKPPSEVFYEDENVSCHIKTAVSLLVKTSNSIAVHLNLLGNGPAIKVACTTQLKDIAIQ